MNENKCFECNSKNNIEHHHVIPKSLGGKKTIPLCIKCHGIVHNRNFIEHRRLQKIGIEKAKKKGVYVGRGKGTKESAEVFLNKAKSRKIIKYLSQGESIRRTALLSNSSINTVRKVKALV